MLNPSGSAASSAGTTSTIAQTDTTPPDAITSFTGTVSGMNVALGWVNPADLDFSTAIIRRSVSGLSSLSESKLRCYNNIRVFISDTTLPRESLLNYWFEPSNTEREMNPLLICAHENLLPQNQPCHSLLAS